MKFSKLFYKGIPSFIVTVYLVVLFCIYPLYMKEGYVGIDAAKYTFFLYTALITIILLLLSGLGELVKSIKVKRFSLFHTALLLFGFTSIVSYLLSQYKDMALYGVSGWYMGLATIMCIIVLTYLISILWKEDLFVFRGIVLVSFLVMLIALTDRFSFYVIPLEIRNPSFLSTIGNINWLAGYMSIFLPLTVGLFALNISDKKEIEYLKEIVMIIMFMSSFAQGSDSIVLCYLSMFFGMLVFVMLGLMDYKRFLIVAIIFCLSSQIVRLLRIVLVGKYNYDDTTGLCAVLTGSSILLIIGVVFILLYLFTDKSVAKYILIILSVVVIVAVAYCIYIFDDSFGSGRGEAFKIAVWAFKEMSIKEKLFGVGPDSFSGFVYNSPRISEELFRVWPNDILTNAHCELLTMLINEGVVGVISFIFIFASFIKENITVSRNKYSLCITLAALCYLVHNIASFMQVENFPFIMILMGMASALNMGETLKLTENSSKLN